MSRELYGPGSGGGSRSPRSSRRLVELPTVDRSPSRSYPSSRVKSGRTASPGGVEHDYRSYYREDDLSSPLLDDRARLMDDRNRLLDERTRSHHRSRSASRPMSASNALSVRYTSLDRSGIDRSEPSGHEREFMPIRESRSIDRSARNSALDRGLYLEDELYGRSAGGQQGSYLGELTHQNNDLHRELSNLKKELELTNQKLGSSMHSIKTFWSPELKKERALRKEESAKYSLINDQLKLLNSENQKQAMLVRQLEEELRMRLRGPNLEMQNQIEVLYTENEHLTREIGILRDTIKELELRIETQKQTLQARDESIKKLLEMLQNKGVGGSKFPNFPESKFPNIADFESGLSGGARELQFKLLESENIIKHYECLITSRDEELNLTKKELKSTNESLKLLQKELEKAYEQGGHAGANLHTNSTLMAILETKDARISTLEKEVDLLEKELARIRDFSHYPIGGGGFGISSALSGGGGHFDFGLDRPNSPPVHDFSFTTSLGGFNFDQYRKQIDELRSEITRRDQEILAMSAKMKTLEEQHQDYQRHISVLKESLCAKEEHYSMLQADVEELRSRLEEKNRHIEKKTQTALTATQEKNKMQAELQEMKDHMDIKDRKINVLQRKLELHEANKRSTSAGTKDKMAEEREKELRLQLEEQKKQLEMQRRKMEEHRKGVDTKAKQLEEKERNLSDLETKLKKRKENLDLMEANLKKGVPNGGNAAASAELQAELDAAYTELEKVKAEAKHSQEEMERLLSLVEMTQGEQNEKDKVIHELQESLKGAQMKLRKQQATLKELEEAARRTEVSLNDIYWDEEPSDNAFGVIKETNQTDLGTLPGVKIDINKPVETVEKAVMTDNILEENTSLEERQKAFTNKKLLVETSDKAIMTDIIQEETKTLENRDITITDQRQKRIDKEMIGEIFTHKTVKGKDNNSSMTSRTQERGEGLEETPKAITNKAIEQGDKANDEAMDEKELDELEQLIDLMNEKNERIEELEMALKESVQMMAEKEKELDEEEERRKAIMEKVQLLEHKLFTVQTAQAVRCASCKPLLSRLHTLEVQCERLMEERLMGALDVANGNGPFQDYSDQEDKT